MIERRNVRSELDATTNNISERIVKLESRQQQRQQIRVYIEAKQWFEALSLAEKAGIFIFEDPAIVRRFPEHLQELQTKAQSVAYEAANKAREAETAYNRAYKALDEVKKILTEQAAMEAFLLADEALRRLDKGQLAEYIGVLEQIVPKLSESWVPHRLNQLLNDQAWLNGIAEWDLQSAGTTSETWNALAKDRPLYNSRVAYLREQTKLTVQPNYIDSFVSLVPILQEGSIDKLQSALSSLENKIKDDSQITPFEKITYLEIASTWHQRANSLEFLRNELAKVNKDITNTAKKAEQTILSKDQHKIIVTSFRQHFNFLSNQLFTLPSELFAVRSSVTINQTIGAGCRTVMKKVLGQLWVSQCQISGNIIQPQDANSPHGLPVKWQAWLQNWETQAKKKEEEGTPFFLYYKSINNKFETVGHSSTNPSSGW
jgi:hypothetical protein